MNNPDENKIPDNFPQDLFIDLDNDSNSSYRRYGDEVNESFYYFVNRILSAINASVTNFHNRKTIQLISQIYTVSDEALGLILLENEYHVWLEQSKPKDKQNENNLKRKYVSCKSGKKNSWASEGKYRFYNFCVKIKELRNNNTYGNKVDEIMRTRFQQDVEFKNFINNGKVRTLLFF